MRQSFFAPSDDSENHDVRRRSWLLGWVTTGLLLASAISFGAEACKANGLRVLSTSQPLPRGIQAMAMAAAGRQLLVLTEDELFVLDPVSLSVAGTVRIKDLEGQALSSYWSAGTMVLAGDQEHVLVLDKYIALQSGKTAATLAVAGAVERGSPNPEALDISPSGRLGLVLVYSFSGGEYNALASFDLQTGRLVQKRKIGETVAHAMFAAEDQWLLFYRDGRITVESSEGEKIRVITEAGPISIHGIHSVMVAGERVVAVAGLTQEHNSRIMVFNPATGSILHQDDLSGGMWIAPDGDWVMYTQVRESKTLCGCKRHPLSALFLKVKNLKTGQVREETLQAMPDLIIYDSTRRQAYAAEHDTVKTLEISTLLSHPAGAERAGP